jgi:UDP-glucose 4-epimerase
MSQDDNFPWAEQAVCVTGARGRLGARIVPALVERGASVVAFDRTPGASPGKSVRARAGDLLRPGDLDRALRGCTLVFHLAAKASAERSFAEPDVYLDTNATGTYALLAACQRNAVKRVVFASSGLVYGRPQTLPVREGHPTAPLSPYAASKLAAEAGLAAYAQALAFSVDIARFSNLYGVDDAPDTVVGSALGCALCARCATSCTSTMRSKACCGWPRQGRSPACGCATSPPARARAWGGWRSC